MLFSTSIAQFDTQIDTIKAQIEELRIKLSNIETEKQNLLAVQQMWESAISQIKSAKDATQAIGQNNLIDDAKTAIDAVFSDLPQLPESPKVETETAETTPQTPNNSDDSITVKAETVKTETTIENPTFLIMKAEVIPTTEGDDFDKLTWNELRKFAAKNGIATKHKTKLDIVLALKAKGINHYTPDTQVS